MSVYADTMRVRTVRELGTAVRDARRLRGWTQAELARRAGVSRQWVVALEKGKNTLELGAVLAAVTALDLVLDLTDPERKPTHDGRPANRSQGYVLDAGAVVNAVAEAAAAAARNRVSTGGRADVGVPAVSEAFRIAIANVRSGGSGDDNGPHRADRATGRTTSKRSGPSE